MEREDFKKRVNELYSIYNEAQKLEESINDAFRKNRFSSDSYLCLTGVAESVELSLKYLLMFAGLSEDDAKAEAGYFMYECDWGENPMEVNYKQKTFTLSDFDAWYDWLDFSYFGDNTE